MLSRKKRLELFPKHTTGKLGRNSKCKLCTSENRKKYRSSPAGKAAILDYFRRNREKIYAYYKKRNATPDGSAKRRLINRKSKLKRAYSITLDEFKTMQKKQRGRCGICGNILAKNDPRGTHIDHCHKTNVVRGLLCNHCNPGLGNFFDNILLLKKAIKYLERHKS